MQRNLADRVVSERDSQSAGLAFTSLQLVQVAGVQGKR